MTIYKPFDVVELPFPFSDLSSSKRRKALVLSSAEFNSNNKATTVLMITSSSNSSWIGDVPIKHWAEAGLNKPCYVRLKIFTADNSIFLKKTGSLVASDQKRVQISLREFLKV